MSNSPFIENSKHRELTKMVEDHFISATGPNTAQMNPSDVKGKNGSNALPTLANDYPFNAETGVNQMPNKNAGHKVGGR
jgi:hypothetical protein